LLSGSSAGNAFGSNGTWDLHEFSSLSLMDQGLSASVPGLTGDIHHQQQSQQQPQPPSSLRADLGFLPSFGNYSGERGSLAGGAASAGASYDIRSPLGPFSPGGTHSSGLNSAGSGAFDMLTRSPLPPAAPSSGSGSAANILQSPHGYEYSSMRLTETPAEWAVQQQSQPQPQPQQVPPNSNGRASMLMANGHSNGFHGPAVTTSAPTVSGSSLGGDNGWLSRGLY